MRGKPGRRSAFAGLWGGLFLGVLLSACGPSSEDEAAEPIGVEEAGDAMAESLSPEELAERTIAALREGSDGQRRGPVSSAFDVSRPRVRPQRIGRAPGVAFDGKVFLVAWEDERPGGVYGTRVKPDGTILDPAGIPIGYGARRGRGGAPRVAFDGTQFVVVWDGVDLIYGRRVSRAGEVVGPAFEIAEGDDSRGPIGLACARELCVVSFTVTDDTNATVARRILSDGTVLDRELIGLSGSANFGWGSSVAWNGREFLIIWSDNRGGDDTPDIYGARLMPDGTVLEPGGVPLITGPGAQRRNDLVWTGKHFLAVWEDTRGGDVDIFGARVEPDLTVKDPGGFPIATRPGDQLIPRAAHHGSKALVVWEDARPGRARVRGARVAQDGEVKEPDGFLVSRGEYDDERTPSVAAGDEGFFVVYAGAPEGSASFEPNATILGVRVRHDGRVRDSDAKRLNRSANRQESPAVAFGDGKYLAVWREVGEDGVPRLLAARMSKDGRVHDSKGLRLPAGTGAMNPAVAFDGSRFLVVWHEPGPDDSLDIRGARVSTSGRLLDRDSLPILVAERDQRDPAVASSGDGFLVVWEDERGAFFGNISDIVGTRVSGGGAVVDPGGFRISEVEDTQSNPSVVWADGHYFVAWGFFRFSSPPLSEGGVDGARVTAGGGVLDTPPILITRGFSTAPRSLSFDGENVLVAWTELVRLTPDTLGTRLRAARVDPGGSVLEPSGVTLVEGAAVQRGAPAVVFDGRVHQVVWPEGALGASLVEFDRPADLFGIRVTPDLRVWEPGVLPISREPGAELQPALASDGRGSSVVLYTEFVLDPEVVSLRVRGRVLRSD